ncbi:MAG: uroporphyrinogen decarboxylase family protein [Planctomycetota bacterium]|jgi:uroporphyrinogen decarboxylase|nr:uroporphyrinogen decarboxylase family protein [Planctomycetota bacterium]MDP7249927.1 uroporphyrinogen decarboxylase family protein [Planctomycetota bacterium]
MTSRERIICALERRVPDRVPLYEAVIDEHVMDALLPGCDYYEFNEWIGLDNASLNRSSWSKENVDWVDEEKGYFRDAWGVVRAFGPESTPYPIEGPIKRPEDLKSYQPPDPHAPTALGHLPEVVERFKGKRAITTIGRDGFFNPSFLRGPEQYLIDMVENPGLVHELIEVCLSHDIPLMRRSIQAGVDVVVLGDDYADKNGPMFSPKHFKEFIVPALEKVVQAAKEEGAYVMKHSDGNIMPLLDMIVGTGVDAINPIEPAAGMDIAEVKELYGDRVAIVGNIDCGALLCNGTPEQVREKVRWTIEAAGAGGGFILSSSNSIHSSVKPENYLAMAEACREFGNYG